MQPWRTWQRGQRLCCFSWGTPRERSRAEGAPQGAGGPRRAGSQASAALAWRPRSPSTQWACCGGPQRPELCGPGTTSALARAESALALAQPAPGPRTFRRQVCGALGDWLRPSWGRLAVAHDGGGREGLASASGSRGPGVRQAAPAGRSCHLRVQPQQARPGPAEAGGWAWRPTAVRAPETPIGRGRPSPCVVARALGRRDCSPPAAAAAASVGGWRQALTPACCPFTCRYMAWISAEMILDGIYRLVRPQAEHACMKNVPPVPAPGAAACVHLLTSSHLLPLALLPSSRPAARWRRRCWQQRRPTC